MARSGAAASAVVLVVMMALVVQSSMAAKYTVGETQGWQLINTVTDLNFYQAWERSHAPYYTADSLEFQWIAPDSVLQVNWAAFQACNTQGPIQAWLANGDGEVTTMEFPLRGYGFHTLYFISGEPGNCARGQKFFIDVFE